MQSQTTTASHVVSTTKHRLWPSAGCALLQPLHVERSLQTCKILLFIHLSILREPLVVLLECMTTMVTDKRPSSIFITRVDYGYIFKI